MLFHRAREQAAGERARFLDDACGGDAALRAEVESLLAHDEDDARRVLPTPPEAPAPGGADGHASVPAGPDTARHAGEPAPGGAGGRDPLDGRRLGPYRIVRKLGEGGMGVVRLAEDTRLGRLVAIKALPLRFARDEGRRRRLRREARAAASLTHPGIATVYALEEFDGALCLVSEYVPGETLRQELAAGPLPPADLLDTAAAIARALAAAHEGNVLHRDLKPENVIRTRGAGLDDPGVKLVDFGLARFDDPGADTASTPRLTAPGAALGTPGYMAPEQIRGEEVDCRTDVFAFGVLLFELASGRHPFTSSGPVSTVARVLEAAPPDLRRLAPACPPALPAIIGRCLRKDPAARYGAVREIVEALERARRNPDAGADGPGDDGGRRRSHAGADEPAGGRRSPNAGADEPDDDGEMPHIGADEPAGGRRSPNAHADEPDDDGDRRRPHASADEPGGRRSPNAGADESDDDGDRWRPHAGAGQPGDDGGRRRKPDADADEADDDGDRRRPDVIAAERAGGRRRPNAGADEPGDDDGRRRPHASAAERAGGRPSPNTDADESGDGGRWRRRDAPADESGPDGGRRSPNADTGRPGADGGWRRPRADAGEPGAAVPAHATTLSPVWWWQFHQRAAGLAYYAMLYPLWQVREWAPAPWGTAVFFAALAAVLVAANLRFHLSFTERFTPAQIDLQRAQSAPWIRAADWLFAGLLLAASALIAEAHPAWASVTAAGGIVSALAFLAIEPATARAAFRRRPPDPR